MAVGKTGRRRKRKPGMHARGVRALVSGKPSAPAPVTTRFDPSIIREPRKPQKGSTGD